MIPGGYGWEPEDARDYARMYGEEEAAGAAAAAEQRDEEEDDES